MTIKINIITKILILLLTIAVIANVSIIPILFPIPSIFFQLFLYGSLAGIFIFFTKSFHINFYMVFLIISIIISIILSTADSRYNINSRFIAWLLLISTIGPLFYNHQLITFRKRLFKTFLFTFMLIGLISFIYFLLGLPHLGRGHFTGVMNHSMVLAPIASIGALYAFFLLIQPNNIKNKFIFLSFFLTNVADVYLAASRISFLGLTAGLLMYFTIKKFPYRKIIILIFIALTTFISINMQTLQQDSKGADTLLTRKDVNTRAELWADRLREFKENPIFGIGFDAEKKPLPEHTYTKFSGKIEPGSTYLMIASMLGLFGIFTISILLIRPFFNKKFLKYIFLQESYFGAIFIFFSIHFIAEGYIFSSGSMMAFIFWLLLGTTYPYNTNSNLTGFINET